MPPLFGEPGITFSTAVAPPAAPAAPGMAARRPQQPWGEYSPRTPSIATAPKALLWTPVSVCTTTTATLNLTNEGTKLLTVVSLTTDDIQFRPTTAVPLDVLPGQTVRLSVQFLPTEARPASAVLRVRSSEHPRARLQAQVIGRLAPACLRCLAVCSLAR